MLNISYYFLNLLSSQGVCTTSTVPSVSSINRILRNRAAERAAAEYARVTEQAYLRDYAGVWAHYAAAYGFGTERLDHKSVTDGGAVGPPRHVWSTGRMQCCPTIPQGDGTYDSLATGKETILFVFES